MNHSYLDQPNLLKKIENKAPVTMTVLAGSYGIYDTYTTCSTEKNKNARKEKFVTNVVVLTSALGSALLAPKTISAIRKPNGKFLKGLFNKNNPALFADEHHHNHSSVKVIEEVLADIKKAGKQVNSKLEGLLNNAKVEDAVLSPKEVNNLYSELNKIGEKKLFDKIIPMAEEEEHSLRDVLTRLSLMGFIPVAGGIAGGAVADKINGKNLKETMPNKIKEGTYQFLANIFLCNIGAGLAGMAVNALHKRGHIKENYLKPVKTASMVAGIALTGVIGGSLISNFIAKKIINPLLSNKNELSHQSKSDMKNINNERHPEAIDIGLHVDDFATVGALSGLSWIESFLPGLYAISGYRAGIGYRN